MVHEPPEVEELESFSMSEGRQRYWRQVREIEQRLQISHQDARQRWNHWYHPGGKPIKKVKKLVLAVRASASDQRTCPFCRDSIYHPDEGGPDYVCTKCQAHYHLDCFEEELGGACATLGCASRRVIGAARTRIRLRSRPRTPTDLEVRPVNTQMEIEEIPNMATLRARQGRPEDTVASQTPEEAQATQDADNAMERGLDRLRDRQSFWEAFWGCGGAFANWIGDNMPAAMLIGLTIMFVVMILFRLVIG